MNVVLAKKDAELRNSVRALDTHRTSLEKAGVHFTEAQHLKFKQPVLPVKAAERPQVESLKQQLESAASVVEMYMADHDAAVAKKNNLLIEKEALLKLQLQEIESITLAQQAGEAESEWRKETMQHE